MKHKNVSMIQYTMHKRTSTNKDKFGGKSTPLLARASRQTSMPTLNNTNEALLFSCTLQKHSSTIMESCPLGKHKQGSSNNAYIKGKT